MKVSPLRQRMLDAMQMRGYSPRTHDSYVQAVLDLSRHYCHPRLLRLLDKRLETPLTLCYV